MLRKTKKKTVTTKAKRLSPEKLRAIGQRLNDARLRADLSQVEVAAKLETSNSRVSMWESGSAQIDLPNLVKICDIYGVNLDQITHGSRQSGLLQKVDMDLPLLIKIFESPEGKALTSAQRTALAVMVRDFEPDEVAVRAALQLLLTTKRNTK